MTTQDRNQIRTALIERFERDHNPSGFSALAIELRAQGSSFSGYRDSQIVSVLHPMVNGGDVAYTPDLRISKPDSSK